MEVEAGCNLKIMKLRIQCPWHQGKTRKEVKAKALEDQKYIRNLFQLKDSYGLESRPYLDDEGRRGYEATATADIEESNYTISVAP